MILINHWRWLQANGTKQQAASCKRQAASLTRKYYNDIQDYKEMYENKRSIKNYRRLAVQAFKDAWLVDRFTCQRMQNRRQAPAVKGSVCYDCYALKGCYVFKVVQDAQYRRLEALQHPDWVRQWHT